MKHNPWGDVLSSVSNVRGVTVCPLGGGALLLRDRDTVILVDPFLTNWSSDEWVRRTEPPFHPSDVTRCSGIFITHEHEDHCDPETIVPIVEQTDCAVFGSSAVADRLRQEGAFETIASRFTQIAPEDRVSCGGAEVHVVHALDPLSDAPVAYLMQWSGVTILLLGDSQYRADHLERQMEGETVDAVFVALGANPPDEKYYFSEEDVRAAAEQVKPALLVPIHWDLWVKTYLDAPAVFASPSGNIRVIEPGSIFTIPQVHGNGSDDAEDES